jgi:hypothetical protein
MPIKKSELYSSLWKSCDEFRGGMDADLAALDAGLAKTCALGPGMRQELLTRRTRRV